MLRGRLVLPAEDADALLTVLEPLARRQSTTDDRSAGQRRADALVEVFAQAARHAELPDAGGARPQLSYVLPADWAARQAAQADCPTCSRCPDHQPGTFLDTVLAGLPSTRPTDSGDSGGATGSGAGGGSRTSSAAERRGAVPPAGHACAVAV